MEAITILHWVAFYLLNAGMMMGAVPPIYGAPLMIVALVFAVAGTQAIKSVENTQAVAQVYATGVKPQDFEVQSGETKAPTA